MRFYTHVSKYGSNILHRGYDNGTYFQTKEDWSPTLFVTTNKPTDWETIDGKAVAPIQPGGIKLCDEYINTYSNITGMSIYGNTNYAVQYTGEQYPGEIQWDITKIRSLNIDIETTVESGFPTIENPVEAINAITLFTGSKFYCLGIHDFDIPFNSEYQFPIECKVCQDEIELLETVLEIFNLCDPDVITGWNIRFFDIPYLVARMDAVLGEGTARQLSPFNRLSRKMINKWGNEYPVVEIVGRSQIDLLETYRKYTFITQESYKLDNIAEVELGINKLDYHAEGYTSFKDFYTRNFQRFMEYNLKDVVIVGKLDAKMNLTRLQLLTAFTAKVNFEDAFSQVKTWDAIIYHYLHDKKIAIPFKVENEEKDEKYEGAYVKDPLVGMHKWVVSYDLNSLYPHNIIQYSIGPDNILNPKDYPKNLSFDMSKITIDSLLNKEHDLSCLKDLKLTLTPNGQLFRMDRPGFISELMQKFYNARKEAQGAMKAAKKKLLDPNLTDTEKAELEDIAKKNNLLQMARKIELNSAYGAIGNAYFRYYDLRQAEAITTAGQLAIRWIANSFNTMLNKVTNQTGKDFIIASDTDSCYINLEDVVNQSGLYDKKEITIWLEKFCDKIIAPFIEREYTKLAEYMNCHKQAMKMGREVIASNAIWTAKKRYILNVQNKDGMLLPKSELKIMGLETNRSSTPKVIRNELKKAIDIIMNEDQAKVIEFVDNLRTKFNTLSVNDIATPTGINGLAKYGDKNKIYIKGTPMQVKAALVYNHYLKEKGIANLYEEIRDLTKAKYVQLKMPNPLKQEAVAFVDVLPTEFKVGDYIDYERHFEKAFLNPLNSILEAIGWTSETKASLDDLFA